MFFEIIVLNGLNEKKIIKMSKYVEIWCIWNVTIQPNFDESNKTRKWPLLYKDGHGDENLFTIEGRITLLQRRQDNYILSTIQCHIIQGDTLLESIQRTVVSLNLTRMTTKRLQMYSTHN